MGVFIPIIKQMHYISKTLHIIDLKQDFTCDHT